MTARPHRYHVLGCQHPIDRGDAASAWPPAGFGRGQWLPDLGCGPDFASDSRFVAAVEQTAQERGIGQLMARRVDLTTADGRSGGAWCLWPSPALVEMVWELPQAKEAGARLAGQGAQA